MDTHTKFRFVNGIPHIDDVPFAATRTFENPPNLTAGYDGFEIHTPNEWVVIVTWATREDAGWPEFQPSGEVGRISAHASGVMESLSFHDPRSGEWPYGEPSDWFLEGAFFVSPVVVDKMIVAAKKRPSPPWTRRDR